MKCFTIKIHGEVQGVGFRYSAQEKAKELNVNGFARNEPDGTVYIEAEGEEENLMNFLKWCYKGPNFAKVKNINCKTDDRVWQFDDFKIT